MNDVPKLAVAGAFTIVHEAHLAKSVLEAAGIEATLADEHVVSMTWIYSNAVGGVKVLVPDHRLEEAKSLLESRAVLVDALSASGQEADADDTASDTCQRCGSREFESRLPGKRFAILSWLVVGFPVGSPLRRRYCRQCAAPALDRSTSA